MISSWTASNRFVDEYDGQCVDNFASNVRINLYGCRMCRILARETPWRWHLWSIKKGCIIRYYFYPISIPFVKVVNQPSINLSCWITMNGILKLRFQSSVLYLAYQKVFHPTIFNTPKIEYYNNNGSNNNNSNIQSNG